MNKVLVDLDPIFAGDDRDDIPSVLVPLERGSKSPAESTTSQNDGVPLRGGKREKFKNQFLWDGNKHVYKADYNVSAFRIQKTRLGTINNTFINSLAWSSMDASDKSD